MGDSADLMLDGVVCQGCGVYLGDPVGYPRSCGGCESAAAVTSNDRRSSVTDEVQSTDLKEDEDLPF